MSIPGGGVTSFGIDSYRVWERGGLCEKSPSLSLVALQNVIDVGRDTCWESHKKSENAGPSLIMPRPI